MDTPIKATVLQRLVAKGVDLLAVFAAAAILPGILGALVGFLYSLIADGMGLKGFFGQSLGKKVVGIQVVEQESRAPIGLRESIIRNSPVGVATFFAIIPVWGWVFLILVGIPLMAIEIYLMLRAEGGRRLGDVMADTDVIRTVGLNVGGEAPQEAPAPRKKRSPESGKRKETAKDS